MSQIINSWEVRPATSARSKDYDIFISGSPASAGKICRVYGREGRDSIVRNYANLIAAAPDLYNALNEAVDIVQMVDDAEGGQLDLLSKIHAAIFKAGGI